MSSKCFWKHRGLQVANLGTKCAPRPFVSKWQAQNEQIREYEPEGASGIFLIDSYWLSAAQWFLSTQSGPRNPAAVCSLVSYCLVTTLVPGHSCYISAKFRQIQPLLTEVRCSCLLFAISSEDTQRHCVLFYRVRFCTHRLHKCKLKKKKKVTHYNVISKTTALYHLDATKNSLVIEQSH